MAIKLTPAGAAILAEAVRTAKPIKPRPEIPSTPAARHSRSKTRQAVEGKKAPKVYHSSKSAEWYTPAHILIAASRVMEGITLDPCAAIRPASRAISGIDVFTKKQNGLIQPWSGNVFLNPPYGKQKDGSTVLMWMQKAAQEVRTGRVKEIVILWKSATDTKAFQTVTDFTLKTCFVSGRLSFSEIKEPAPFPSAIFYYGENPEGFEIGFNEIGTVWTNPRPQEA